MLDAADEGGVQTLDVAGQLDLVDARQQVSVRDLQLEPREGIGSLSGFFGF